MTKEKEEVEHQILSSPNNYHRDLTAVAGVSPQSEKETKGGETVINEKSDKSEGTATRKLEMSPSSYRGPSPRNFVDIEYFNLMDDLDEKDDITSKSPKKKMDGSGAEKKTPTAREAEREKFLQRKVEEELRRRDSSVTIYYDTQAKQFVASSASNHSPIE